jgi:hypothetical protein
MTIESFVMPSHTVHLRDDKLRVIGYVTLAGEVLRMPCAKKTQFFEMHKYHGPWPCNKNGDTAVRVAADFWDRYEQWNSGGRLVDGDLCVVPE